VAVAIAVLGLVGAWFLGERLPDPPAPVAEFGSGTSEIVRLEEEGLTILREYTVSGARCAVQDSAGQEVDLTLTGGGLEVTAGGTTWAAVYETSQPVPPGTYTVACESYGGTDRFAVAPYNQFQGSVDAFVYSTLGAAVAVSLVVTAVVFVRRRRSRRRMRIMSRGAP